MTYMVSTYHVPVLTDLKSIVNIINYDIYGDG
jgi:hypothetical protein